MIPGRNLFILLMLATTLGLGACASLPQREPLEVTVAGIEPLQGEGMELRMLVKLRVQNPNDAAIDFSGASVKLEVQGKTFATGVSDASGNVPRFGEAVIEVPVTASMFRMVNQAMGVIAGGEPPRTISYRLTGKLGGTGFLGRSFETEGEFDLPRGATRTDAPAAL